MGIMASKPTVLEPILIRYMLSRGEPFIASHMTGTAIYRERSVKVSALVCNLRLFGILRSLPYG